jgi:peptidoglycan/LPS O-acetylase OafA/YrhL
LDDFSVLAENAFSRWHNKGSKNMNSNDTKQNGTVTGQDAATKKSTRLHYLDWLQVLAILGVFVFHAVHPFDDLVGWHIKNTEKSILATFYTGFFNLWGMPFFFFMAGATSWFSLKRRTASRYVRERVTRLLVPFIIGSIVLTPIQAYYEFVHKGWWEGNSIIEFVFSAEARTYFFTEYNSITFNPQIFGDVGYHLWFVGFLFAFSLIALPIFIWLKNDFGKQTVASLARPAEWRGGLLIFTIPLILIGCFFQPFLSGYTGWASFLFLLVFFIFGYILIADERFTQAIRRDWRLHLILGITCTMFFFSVAADVPVWDWLVAPGTSWFYVSWLMWGINSWCWTMVMMYIGMRFLNYTNKWLQYGREASYPFFFVHQPVIIFIAFYAVQWNTSLLIKLLVVVFGAFAATLSLYEFLVRRINPVRALFGMKPRRRKEAKTKTPFA